MIAHIMLDEKFTPGFVRFVSQNYKKDEHIFLITCGSKKRKYTANLADDRVVYIYKSVKDMTKMLHELKKSSIIIVHGMFNIYVVTLLLISGLIKKTYWYIWGGDLYDYDKESSIYHSIKKEVCKNLKGVISPFEGDYLLARTVYGVKGEWIYCLLPSTIVKESKYILTETRNNTINIMIGNSADNENKHFELIDKVIKYGRGDYHVYIPLSYGDKEYATSVSDYARRMMGDTVTILDQFMPYEEYLSLLSTIDIAVYGHRRQQAFGNIVQLLSLGAKVYIDSNVSTWDMLVKMGMSVFDTKKIDFDLCTRLSEYDKANNETLILENFSEEKLIEQWEFVFSRK